MRQPRLMSTLIHRPAWASLSSRHRRKSRHGKRRRLVFESLSAREMLSVAHGPGPDNTPSTAEQMSFYRRIDVSDDGMLSPMDALLVINHLNQSPARYSSGYNPRLVADLQPGQGLLDVNND
ncbi:MAG: hypothetical protein ACC628_11975, partial [Pirellulaceae bacterium]